MAGSGTAAGTPSAPPEAAREPSSVIASPLRLATLTEFVGPPPAGVAPLDQIREAMLLSDEATERPPNAGALERTNNDLLRYYRHEADGGYREQNIRTMVDRGGWAEVDAVVVELCLSRIAPGIGLAVRERRTVAAVICHGLYLSIACVGEQMASPAPDLFLLARLLPKPGMRQGLFDCEPLAAAFEGRGGGEGRGDAVTLCAPLSLVDRASRLTDRGALLQDGDGAHHVAPGDVICIRSRPNALPYCRTAALVIGACPTPGYALPPNTQLTLEAVLEPPWTATHRRWHRYEDEDGFLFATSTCRAQPPLANNLPAGRRGRPHALHDRRQ